MHNQNTPHDTITCKSCGGWQRRTRDGSGHPWGWLQVSVSIPPELDRDGRKYIWLGVWCSAACLDRSLPDLITAETRARREYEADLPLPRDGRDAA